MLNLVDVKKGLCEAALKKRRHFILFVVATLLTLTIEIILMVTSKNQYVIELIFSIIFGIIYSIYLVFYFSVIKRCIDAEYRFYEGAANGEHSEIFCSLTSLSKDIKEHNGLEYYVLEAKVDDNLKEEDKIFYVAKRFEFKKNQKAILYVYGSVVISLEIRK